MDPADSGEAPVSSQVPLHASRVAVAPAVALSPDSNRDDMSGIRKALENEQRLRAALSARVVELETEIEEAEQAKIEYQRELADRNEALAPKAIVELEEELAVTVEERLTRDAQEGEAPWFNRDALLAACGSDSSVAQIEERWEQFEMDKLYLHDDAERSGYLRKPKYKRRLRRLEKNLRAEYGPEGYDAFLFAVGKPNRVLVEDVISNSPAGRAGLQSGDVVIRYDTERVFFQREFQHATSLGEPDDLVLLDVLRDGEELLLRVPRGPLGIRMKSQVAPPLSCY